MQKKLLIILLLFLVGLILPSVFAVDTNGSFGAVCAGQCIQLGTAERTITAPCNGTMELVFNDDIYFDNYGTMHATINGQAVSVPGGYTDGQPHLSDIWANLPEKYPKYSVGSTTQGASYTISSDPSARIMMNMDGKYTDPDGYVYLASNPGTRLDLGTAGANFVCPGLVSGSLVARFVPTEATHPASCTDSDGGYNKFVQGTCIDANNTHYTDDCWTAGSTQGVSEWTCMMGPSGPTGACVVDRSDPQSVCPYGCFNGACLAAPITYTCTQSESGADIYHSGTLTIKGSNGSLLTSGTELCLNSTVSIPDGTNGIGIMRILQQNPGSVSTGIAGAYVSDFDCTKFDGNDPLTALLVFKCAYGCNNGACAADQNSYVCYDSDGGKNYSVKGYGIGQDGMTYYDSCQQNQNPAGPTPLIDEYYCSGNALYHEATACPSGTSCSNGACIQDTNSSPVCFDSDGGFNYFVKGSATSGSTTVQDSCSGNHLLEAYCMTTGYPGTYEYPCPNGCSNGACLSQPQPTCTSDSDCQGTTCPNGVYMPGICSSGQCIASTCPPTPVNSCTDSDGGVNYSTKGLAIGTDENTGAQTEKYDYCVYNPSSGTYTGDLVETSCKNNLVHEQTTHCSNGCGEGACLSAPTDNCFGQCIQLGSSEKTISAPCNGTMELAFNDQIFFDNSGFITAKINGQQALVPGGYPDGTYHSSDDYWKMPEKYPKYSYGGVTKGQSFTISSDSSARVKTNLDGGYSDPNGISYSINNPGVTYPSYQGTGQYVCPGLKGNSLVAKFVSASSTPQQATESIKCVFNSSTQQQCYSDKGSCTATPPALSPPIDSNVVTPVVQSTCVVQVSGNMGEQVVWKSSCGGYAYTTIDGQNEYANFNCGDSNASSYFRSASWACGDGRAYNQNSQACRSYEDWKSLATGTCAATSTTTSGGAPVVTNATAKAASGGQGLLTGFFGIISAGETTTGSTRATDVNSSVPIVTSFSVSSPCTPGTTTCPVQTNDDLNRIRENCDGNGEQVTLQIDDSNCSKYVCTSGTGQCIDVSKVDALKTNCQLNGGKFVFNTNADGCVSFADCLGIVSASSSINTALLDKASLLSLALKIEQLKMELDDISTKLEALASYYSGKGNVTTVLKFNKVDATVKEASTELQGLETTIRDNADNFDEAKAAEVRDAVRQITQDTLSKALIDLTS